MYMDSLDTFEDAYRSFLLPYSKRENYEHQLLYITYHCKYEIVPIVEDFVPLVKNDHLTSWFHYLRKETDDEMYYNKKRTMTSRKKKEVRMLVRNVFRSAKQDINVLRVCDLLLYSILLKNQTD